MANGNPVSDDTSMYCVYCCELIVGIAIVGSLFMVIGAAGAWVGMGIIVFICGGTCYGRSYFEEKKMQEQLQRQKLQHEKILQEQLLEVRKNAWKLLAMFSMASKVLIEDMRSIMDFEDRQDAIDLLLAIKERVPGLQVDGETVSVPNLQDLADALASLLNDPTLKTVASGQDSRAPVTPQNWLCEACGLENRGDAKFCAGCGAPRSNSPKVN